MRAILGHFSPNFGKNKFSWKNWLCQFLNIQIIYHRANNQKKLMAHSWEKRRTEGRTDWQTDNGDFIGPSVRRSSDKGDCHDEISIATLKLCASSVCRPLQNIYKSCFLLFTCKYIRKMVNSRWKIIVRFPCYLYVIKSFHNYSTILNLFPKPK